MSSNPVIIENPPITNGQLSSTNNKLTDLYSPYKTHSSSPNLSRSSSSSSTNSSSSSSSSYLSNKNNANSSINKINSDSSLSSNHRKESTLKLPYPVLSDHRDPSSVLILLQKETQTTSKKMSDVIKQIEECEQRLTLNIYTDNEKKTFKYERVKLKQQLDGLKKHDRRVSLQIDFITTKSEIKGLEDEQNSDESQQIKILLGKLKQKLDKMKIYMRTRNEQMKKLTNKKQISNDNRKSSLSSSQNQHLDSSSGKDFNRKRSSTSANNSHLNKRLKPTPPIVRLTSRVTSHDSKNHSTQPLIVRFINKTTNSKINSASPTTPASSSSTLSPPLIASTSISNANTNIKKSLQQNEIPSVDDDELDLELDIDELFNDDSYSEQTVKRLKAEMNEFTRQLKQNPEIK